MRVIGAVTLFYIVISCICIGVLSERINSLNDRLTELEKDHPLVMEHQAEFDKLHAIVRGEGKK